MLMLPKPINCIFDITCRSMLTDTKGTIFYIMTKSYQDNFKGKFSKRNDDQYLPISLMRLAKVIL